MAAGWLKKRVYVWEMKGKKNVKLDGVLEDSAIVVEGSFDKARRLRLVLSICLQNDTHTPSM